MSGKPATPPASRVAVPGAPRLLVYVADPRQLEAGGTGAPRGRAPCEPGPPPLGAPPCLTTLYQPDNSLTNFTLPLRNNVYHTHYEQCEQKFMGVTDAVYYKTVNETGVKTHRDYTIAESSLAQNADIINVSQSFLKNNPVKVDDDGKVNNISNVENVGIIECNSLEYQNRVATDRNGIHLYQMRYTPEAQDAGVIATNQALALNQAQGQREFNSEIVSVNSEVNGVSEKDKNYRCMNYKYLEQQCVSKQSIVSQSINIVNKSVEVHSGEVATLPLISVPLGWRRIFTSTSVFYISPSGTALSTLPQLREYLQTAGTCKCGLPCPLRPESTFSFDPKIASKPYQAPTGPELAKLCNHKRKLLATLQAKGNTSGTPPPQIEQKKVTEVTLLRKKMKKSRTIPGALMSSQVAITNDKPVADCKNIQDGDRCRTGSTGLAALRINPLNYNTLSQQQLGSNMRTAIDNSDNINKTDFQVQRTGSHYLTVNNGWINPEPLTSTQNASRQVPLSTVNVAQPVHGARRQDPSTSTTVVVNSNKPLQAKEHEKDKNNKVFLELSNQKISQIAGKQSCKEEESHIFCGLNQPLTPEVMQKINEQQQIFIQQNQKQIEMAMKGFRTQMAENVNTSYAKSQCQNNYMTQGQLVIQNGTVMKTNPGKTPPWQVKRQDATVAHTMDFSPNSQTYENTEYEESHNSIAEDTGKSTNTGNSFSTSPSNDHLDQNMCSRVPPLPQQYTMMNQQWSTTDSNKKKSKTKVSKKRANAESKNMAHNNAARGMEERKGKTCNDQGNINHVPSFIDDPNGYLAQQTTLLNNTISRQVAMNSSYEHNQFENLNSNYINNRGDLDKSSKIAGKLYDFPSYRTNISSNPSPSPNSTPDSSVLSDKSLDSASQCCKGCIHPSKSSYCDQYFENTNRRNFVRQSSFCNKLEIEAGLTNTSPKNNLEDNPVTSSTFIDRNLYLHDNCEPIQAGTVSTSNVSPLERLQQPEPSPTPSNSSRSTDTPHSNSSGSQQFTNYNFPVPSPSYSNTGSYYSNPPTPGSAQSYSYSSPGPPNNQMITGTQVMHFISNHNINKNLMDIDNISLVGVKPAPKNPSEDLVYVSENKRRTINMMPGYCPPPHLGGGPAHSLLPTSYMQNIVTTMASGFSVTRDTVTSVLAGKAQTATTSINASHNFIRLPPPPSVNLATSYAIPNNQPDPFINSVNLPTSYPLHIAGTTAQNMISKSPLEMVQNVIGNMSAGKSDVYLPQTNLSHYGKKTVSANPGQILISSTRQIVVSTGTPMPPPPPKTTSPIHISSIVTNTTGSLTQVLSAVGGGVQSVVNQPTMVVNTLPAPFVLQPPMMAVESVQQNSVLPQIVTGGLATPGHSPNESPQHMDMKTGQGFIQGVAMLSPESLKRKTKKKKNHGANVTNVLQINAPQPSHNNIMMHHTSPQHNSGSQFSPRGFQLSPNNNVSTPMLQALTIVPGKSGTPAHIVMSGQGNPNNFGSQQIISNTSPTQQINLLQPVNLLNNTGGVMQNFPAFQQFIVPNIGGMMMTTDGTIIQDNSTGVQLQLQTVNGQNVLTPVQNSGVFATGTNAGVVLRAQTHQGKIMQSQHSPGAQFLSPNNQVMMNSPNFNSQLSPLLANLSPTSVTYQSPHQMRSTVQQDFMHTNQMGQTLMVPLSPKSVTFTSAPNNRSNSTFVQQNTTIVQQQTTLVSNSHNSNLQSNSGSRLNIDPNMIISNTHKQITGQMNNRTFMEMRPEHHMQPNVPEQVKVDDKPAMEFRHIVHNADINNHNEMKESNQVNDIISHLQDNIGFNVHVRHSVSTQTLVNQRGGKSPNSAQVSGSSPPDTTTHSPLGPLEGAASSSPRLYAARSLSTQANYADTTTKSPEPVDNNSLAMVQCVSSSEQDITEQTEHAIWPAAPTEFVADSDTQSLMSNMQRMRPPKIDSNGPVDTNEIHYKQTISVTSVNNQQSLTITPTTYYDRPSPYKRKNEFGDISSYRTEKHMRTGYSMVHGPPKDIDFESSINIPEKSSIFTRHYPATGSTSDRHNLGASNDPKPEETQVEEIDKESTSGRENKSGHLQVGQLVWGPVKGYASWPGKLVRRGIDGRWLVQWFGGDKPAATGCVDTEKILTLTEGLEAHHAARTKHRKSRKLNINLENAIQEAMAELDKKSEPSIEISAAESSMGDANKGSGIIETPKKIRKKYEIRSSRIKIQKKCSSIKMSTNINSKNGEGGTRLRNPR